jgi:dihydrofolate reductase
MKVILDMVISPNGLIARDDGDEDWLPSEGWDDFVKAAKRYNNIVMGRETYEQVTTRYKNYNFDSVECEYKIIVTQNSQFKAPFGYVVVHSPEKAIEFLQEQNSKELFLIGGGKLNSAFAKRGLINEIHLTITPYIIGKGRPFLSREEFELPLTLIGHKELSKGRIQVQYLVS